MVRSPGSGGAWFVALLCAAAAAYSLRDERPALYVVPVLCLVGVVLLWLRPWVGVVVVLFGVAAVALLGVPSDNPAVIATTVVTAYLLGRLARRRYGLVFVATAAATVVLYDMPRDELVASLVFLSFLGGSSWTFGRLVRRRADAAERAHLEAERIAGIDTGPYVQRIVEEERRRLAAELVSIVTSAVTDMRSGAVRAQQSLDVTTIRSIAATGNDAITEMRRLIGLLRSEPAEVRKVPAGPLTRQPRRWVDPLLAIACGALAAAEGASSQASAPVALWPLAFGVAAVWLRRKRPLLSVMLFLVPVVAALWFGAPNPGAATVGSSVALALVGWAVGSRGEQWSFAGLAVLTALSVALVNDSDPGNEAITVVWAALPFLAGYLWTHFESAERADDRRAWLRQAEIDGEVARAVAQERLSIARDLHDVTSHAVGVMVLQAGAAEATATSKPDRARTALGEAIAAGDQALHELSSLARVLGPVPDVDDGGDFAERLGGLIGRMRAAGLDITVQLTSEPRGRVAAQTAYRVVQEALTNAARHAPGSKVVVRVAHNEDGLQVSVVNDGSGHAGPGRGSGFGLVGLAERVRAYGGTLTAGVQPAGGFGVTADVPGVPKP